MKTGESFRSFTDFSVWQKGFKLLILVYDYSSRMPKHELYILSSDLRRSANSVVHNIAEGYGRQGSRDKTKFYKYSRASAYEAMSQILVCKELAYFNTKEVKGLLQGYKDVIKELNKLIKTIESKTFS